MRRRLQHLVREAAADGVGRRPKAILLAERGIPIVGVAQLLQAARSSLYRWIDWFNSGGENELHRRRPKTTVSLKLVAFVKKAIEKSPHEFNYLRTNRTSVMVAQLAGSQLAVHPHSSTVRRLLPIVRVASRASVLPLASTPVAADAAAVATVPTATSAIRRRTPAFRVDLPPIFRLTGVSQICILYICILFFLDWS
ncbi:MAG: helix-turn-helix domain-containing protein [Myxococcales bacterium]|nr:helix-turn-helix domain-containing protein [Myxococcales bacterium]